MKFKIHEHDRGMDIMQVAILKISATRKAIYKDTGEVISKEIIGYSEILDTEFRGLAKEIYQKMKETFEVKGGEKCVNS